MRLLNLILAASACGCAGSGIGADLPYRFRQSLIDPEANAPVATVRPATRPAPGVRDASRCRGLVGRELRGAAGRSTLLRVCTGVVPRRLPVAEGISLRADPELLDLALFRSGPGGHQREPVDLGVVLARSGPRIEFVFIRGGRARLGLLNLAQPHRRRLPGSARVENSYLRLIERGDPFGTRYLAGELLAGFVSAANL